MVGAGFSRNAEKSRPAAPEIPLWSDLAIRMYLTLYPPSGDPSSPTVPAEWSQPGSILSLAQEYEAAFGEKKLYELVETQLRDDYYKPGDFHGRLLRLPWRDVFTTNWDTLLERTRASVIQRAYGLVRTMDEIPSSPRPRIVKLHGCLSMHNKLIFTEEDYRTYQTHYAPFVNTVQQAMMETVFCLIGFSGDDPNFLHWSGWVRDNLGPSAPRIYLAGWLGLSPHRRRMLEARNVMPIDLAQHPKASTWPDALRHKYATDWLLTTLELGRPYDISDWPLFSTKHHPVPATHLEPVQKLQSSLPKSEHMPDRKPDGKTENDLDSVNRIINIWAHNRRLYPGWLVIPFRRVQQLSSYTQEWHDIILETLPKWDPDTRLASIGELVWRKCILMEPFQPELTKAIEELLGVIDCQREVIDGTVDKTLNWQTIRATWLMVAGALVTEARHQLDSDVFHASVSRLAPYRNDNPDLDHMLHHEVCMWAAAALDYEGLRSALTGWDTDTADPAWMMRKSALLFEAGLHDEAERLVDGALVAIREHAYDGESLANPSREGWALWSALKREDLFENPIDAVRKWEELAVLKCNANIERDCYAESLDKRSEDAAGRPFDLGVVPGENITFSNATYHGYLAAYRAIRLTELAGLPPAQGGVAVASGMLGLAASALMPHEPEVATRLILRITTYDKDKRLNSILSRAHVASMPKEAIERLSSNIFEAVDFFLPRISIPGGGGREIFWLERLRVAIEALSRLVVRLDEEKARETLDRALGWYSCGAIAKDPWMSEAVKNVLSRSWEALPESCKKEQLIELLALPIVGVDGFSAFGMHYPDPGHLLMNDTVKVVRSQNQEQRWHDIVRLLVRGLQQDGEARKRASIRLAWLINNEMLTDSEEQAAIEALWGPDYCTHDNLPEGTALYDWVFLTLREPEEGVSESRFRRKWLETSMPLTEAGEHVYKILWQVGIAIRGLGVKGKPLSLSQDEQCYLASAVGAWSRTPGPTPMGYSGDSKFPMIVGKEFIEWAIEGLESILLEIEIPESDSQTLYSKVQRLRSYGIKTMRLMVGLVKVLPNRSDDIVQDMRMALASDDDRLATDALRGLWYWLQMSREREGQLVEPSIDLIREIGIIIATRRKAALSLALQAAKWIFVEGSVEQRESIGELASQGIGFLKEELSYEREHDADLDVPLLRWGCTHLAIVMHKNGCAQSPGVAQWLADADTDPLPEVRYARGPDHVSLVVG